MVRPRQRISREQRRARKDRAARLASLLKQSGMTAGQLAALLNVNARGRGGAVTHWALRKYAAGTSPMPLRVSAAIAVAFGLRKEYVHDGTEPASEFSETGLTHRMHDHFADRMAELSNVPGVMLDAARRLAAKDFEEELDNLGIRPARREEARSLALTMLEAADQSFFAALGPPKAEKEIARRRLQWYIKALRLLAQRIKEMP